MPDVVVTYAIDGTLAPPLKLSPNAVQVDMHVDSPPTIRGGRACTITEHHGDRIVYRQLSEVFETRTETVR